MEKVLIDTSILIEPFVPQKNNAPNYKEASLALIKGELYPFYQRFIPTTSISLMGELSLIVNDKSFFIQANKEKILRMEEIIKSFLNKCNKVGLKKETIYLCNQLFSIDSRIEPLDALHISTAIVENCPNFIFIDNSLKDNIIIKKFAKDRGLNLINFGIKENMDKKRFKDDLILHE